VAAALCVAPGPAGRVRLCYAAHPGRHVDNELHAEFVRGVAAAARGPVVLVQDNGPLHRGDWTDDLEADRVRRLAVEWLPAYAPELNPAEYLFAWAKGHALAGFVPADLDELTAGVTRALDAAADDQRLLRACLAASPLYGGDGHLHLRSGRSKRDGHY